MSAFFDMGGYGEFVWPAYGISALVLGFLVAQGFSRMASLKAQRSALEKSNNADQSLGTPL